jgi:hypothetical protein
LKFLNFSPGLFDPIRARNSDILHTLSDVDRNLLWTKNLQLDVRVADDGSVCSIVSGDLVVCFLKKVESCFFKRTFR